MQMGGMWAGMTSLRAFTENQSNFRREARGAPKPRQCAPPGPFVPGPSGRVFLWDKLGEDEVGPRADIDGEKDAGKILRLQGAAHRR